MDPITLILQAIAANIAAGTITSAAKMTYDKLRKLIINKFLQDSTKKSTQFAEVMLSKYESDPKAYEESFRKELEEVDAGSDQNILEATFLLLKELGVDQKGINMSQKIINKSKIGSQTIIQQANNVEIGSKKGTKN